MSDRDFSALKKKVLERLKNVGIVKSKIVEEAFLKVPREEFLPNALKHRAYDDTPLPIGWGQTISAIHMVLIMLEELKLEKGLKILEVGGGSGYHAALCAEAVYSPDKGGIVHTVERIGRLAVYALKNLIKTGYNKIVRVYHRDGTEGLPEKAPYDRILVTAASPIIPPPLIKQLKDPGRLLIPVGGRHLWQDLILIEKINGKVKRNNLGGVAFVPLIGKYGYKG
ncbi:MAG: protein-L-isoaspartate(D-aspartate) O-methyltransferase [Candidatus Odinarchaeia archaeon]